MNNKTKLIRVYHEDWQWLLNESTKRSLELDCEVNIGMIVHEALELLKNAY